MSTCLYNISFLITNAFHIYVVYSFMKLFFKNNEICKSKAIVLYSLQYIISSVIYLFFSYPLLNLFSTILLLFIISLSYNSKIRRKIAATILIFLTTFVSEAIVAFFTGITETSPYINQKFGDVFSLTMVELLTFIIIKIVSRFRYLNNDLPVPWLFIVTIIIVPTISIFIKLQIFMQGGFNTLIYALSLIYVVTLNFIVFYLYDSLAKVFSEKMQKEQSRKELLYYQKQAELIQRNYESSQRLRHDFKNYIIVLKEYIVENDQTGAIRYLDSISNIVQPSKMYSSTGILAIDSIINYKFLEAEEKGINVDATIAIPNVFEFNIQDYVAILGNLLDNSIEAASKSENEKYINLIISYSIGTIFVIIKNSFDGKLNMSEDKFISTKADFSVPHGLGLESIKTAVENCHGEMKITHTKNEFLVKLLLLS